MSNAQKVMQDLLELVRGPVDNRLLLATDHYFGQDRIRMRTAWRGVAAGPKAFSALVEAVCEVMDPRSLAGVSQLIKEAEKTGYFAFDGSVHGFDYANPEERSRGELGQLQESYARPVSIILRRLAFLEDFYCARMV